MTSQTGAAGTAVKTFEQLVEKIRASEKPYDLEKITQAYKVAEKAHEGQLRTSGDPYITHPLAVASILLDYCMDTDTICAALLHDTVEDTDVTLDELRKKFGEDVALMVDGVTKIGAAGGEYPEDTHGYVEGYPGNNHQACRPPSQHENSRGASAGEAAQDLP